MAIAGAIRVVIHIIIAYAGIIPLADMIPFSIRVYLFKVFCELAALPLTMWVINKIKVKETLDIFDVNTRFTPFSLDVTYTDVNNRMPNIGSKHDDDLDSEGKPLYHPARMAK